MLTFSRSVQTVRGVCEGSHSYEGEEGGMVEVTNSRECQSIDENIHCQLSHIAH